MKSQPSEPSDWEGYSVVVGGRRARVKSFDSYTFTLDSWEGRMNPIYVWKRLPESVRAVGLALLIYALYVGVAFDPMAVTDWKAYALAIGTGLVQAGCTAGLAQMGRK